MQRTLSGGRMQQLAVSLAGAFLFGSFALYNGYPIVNGDTATYLNSGFSLTVPGDRTIFYGLFLRATSLGVSLWLSVFVQCLLLAWLLGGLVRGLVPRIGAAAQTGLLAIVAFGTIASWYAGQLMADAFTPVLFLASVNFLFFSKGQLQSVLLAVVLLLATIMHLSHCVVATLFALVLLAASLRRRGRLHLLRGRLLVLAGVSGLAWLLVMGSNAVAGNGFVTSKASHVFLMGKMAESGVLNMYLDRTCPTRHLALCAYKDSLQPRAAEFVWSASSPVNRTGGPEANRAEYSAILHDIVSTPSYWHHLIWRSMEATARQLVLANIDEAEELSWARYEPDHPVYRCIGWYVPYEIKEFAVSRQNGKLLNIPFYDDLYIVVLVSSSLICLFGLRGGLWKEARPVYLLTVLFLLVNAFATATFANVLSRLNSRVLWLLPAVNVIFIYKLILQEARRLLPRPKAER